MCDAAEAVDDVRDGIGISVGSGACGNSKAMLPFGNLVGIN